MQSFIIVSQETATGPYPQAGELILTVPLHFIKFSESAAWHVMEQIVKLSVWK
jgi:hypothetical protein